MNYYIFEKDGNITYSIDNIRLIFDLQYEYNYKMFCLEIDKYRCYYDENSAVKVTYYHSNKAYTYENLFVFKNVDGNSFSIGFNLVKPGKNDFSGFVDFNPNKVGDWEYFQIFYDSVFAYFKDVKIKRFDLAIDIPIAREFVKLIKDRRSYHYLQDRSITEYLGKRNNHNFVKLYDKAYESNLEYDLTRLEITIDPDEQIIFPDIRIHKLQEELCLVSLTPTDKVMLQLLDQVSDPFRYIQQLSPSLKRKYKKLMDCKYDKFEANMKIVYKLLGVIMEMYQMRRGVVNG